MEYGSMAAGDNNVSVEVVVVKVLTFRIDCDIIIIDKDGEYYLIGEGRIKSISIGLIGRPPLGKGQK